MSDNVECPFCGVLFQPEMHPFGPCPVSTYNFTREQWNMRPPKKEQPARTVIMSEVEYLRSLVERAVLRNVPLTYTDSNNLGPVYASRSGAGPEVEK